MDRKSYFSTSSRHKEVVLRERVNALRLAWISCKQGGCPWTEWPRTSWLVCREVSPWRWLGHPASCLSRGAIGWLERLQTQKRCGSELCLRGCLAFTDCFEHLVALVQHEVLHLRQVERLVTLGAESQHTPRRADHDGRAVVLQYFLIRADRHSCYFAGRTCLLGGTAGKRLGDARENNQAKDADLQ